MIVMIIACITQPQTIQLFSAASAAVVVSAADAAAVLLCLPFCHLSVATFLSTSSGGLGHVMSLYCSGKYCCHLLYSSAC